MMKTCFQVIFFALLASLFSCTQKEKSWHLVSPDGKVQMNLFLDEGQLYYSSSLKTEIDIQDVIKKSPLGVTCQEFDFSNNLEFAGKTPIVKIDEQYEVVTGKALKLHNLANECSVSFLTPSGKMMDVVIRAYNDGIAFRYRFNLSEKEELTVTRERTGFKLGQGKVWIQSRQKITEFSSGYESINLNEIPIGENSPEKNGWNFPVLFNSGKVWGLITEAESGSIFYAAHLEPEVIDDTYQIRLPEEEEARGNFSRYAKLQKGNTSSAWRVIIFGNDLNTIASSNLVRHVSPKNKTENISWIKPGRVSWSWLSDHDSPEDYNKLKDFVDLAVEMNWEYSLVDANWDRIKNGNIRQLVDYAKTKNVGIMVWYNSGGVQNIIPHGPRDVMSDSEKRKEEFAKLQSWGVKGVKIDFFQSDKPSIIQLYKDILEDAAEYHLLVNFHGCTLPRGWSRAYPHLMTMESVKGAECYTYFAQYPELVPAYNTLIPVSRNVVGPMDYTPVTFFDFKYPHLTTNAHELALSVLFESGLLHFGDKVGGYRNLTEAPKEFLKTVPVVWEETRYVHGWPGKEMVLARRNGNTWYVAGVNGEKKNKEIQFELSFIESGQWKAEIIKDGENSRSFGTEELSVSNNLPVKVSMQPYGGFIMKISQ